MRLPQPENLAEWFLQRAIMQRPLRISDDAEFEQCRISQIFKLTETFHRKNPLHP